LAQPKNIIALYVLAAKWKINFKICSVVPQITMETPRYNLLKIVRKGFRNFNTN